MAIRISHGRAETIGQMGLEAGKGEQKVTQQAQQLERDLTDANNASRIQAAQINASTAMNKAVMDAKNMREMAEFDSFMRAESGRRQIAWETEKIEMRQRHDFEMNIQRKDLENTMIMEQKTRKDAEKQVRTDALDKAKENGDIGPNEYSEAILSMEVGPEASRALFGQTSMEDVSSFGERARARTTRKAGIEAAKPESVAMRTADLITQIVDEVKNLTPETQEQVRKLVKTPNLPEAAAAEMLSKIRQEKEVLDAKNRTFRMAGPDYGSLGAFAK